MRFEANVGLAVVAVVVSMSSFVLKVAVPLSLWLTFELSVCPFKLF